MRLEIVSPERTLLTADVDSVIVPGTDGSFQMLDNHAPIVSTFCIVCIRHYLLYELKVALRAL